MDELTTEIKKLGTTLAEQIAAQGQKMNEIQKQLDAQDLAAAERHGGGGGGRDELKVLLEQNDGVMRLLKDHKGAPAVITIPLNLIERKTNITSGAVGAQTTGVLTIDRVPGITPEARQRLLIRDLLVARPTTLQICDFVKVTTPMVIGSPQTEANDKGENAVVFTAASEKVQTIATWIPASRQVLDDMSELMNFLTTSLPYYVDLEEELQLLSGAGTGVNLHGLIPQAASFETSLLSNTAGWNRIDIIGRTIQQIEEAKELAPSFVALNPRDWWAIRLTKDAFGRYILGDPGAPAGYASTGGTVTGQGNIFGLTPVPTTSIAAGTFLVGSGSPIAVEIRDRMEMQVEIATQHADFFVKNLIALRAEKRCALLCKRPNSFVTGTFSTSP